MNAEAEASGAPRKPEITPLDRYPLNVNDPDAGEDEMVVTMSLGLALDLAGTFVFALSGAMAGVKNKLDLFGLIVVRVASSDAIYCCSCQGRTDRVIAKPLLRLG